MSHPSAIAVDTEGQIVVADTYNDRILVFTPHGEHVLTFGEKRGKVRGPRGVAVSRDYIIVSDENTSIKIFNRQGKYLRSLQTDQTEKSMTISANGRVVIVLESSGLIRMFDIHNGRRVGELNAEGNGIPHGIAIDASDRLVIAAGRRIRVLANL